MMTASRSAKPSPRSGWEPEPLQLPLELPHLPPEAEPADPSAHDDEIPAGGHVIVLDIS
jgi:hypothetical protein